MTDADKKKEIALLGGAFDPVTRGHIQLAKYVLTTCDLFDEVWILPCYSHVYDKHMVQAEHRLKMCEIAAADYKRIRAFDYEIKHQFTRGTYYLMQKLMADKFSTNFNYSMIIGQDNANTFQYWIKYDLLQKLIRFVVVPRKGIKPDENISWYLQPPHIYLTKDCQIMNVSSTKVRNMLNKRDISGVEPFTDPAVLEYILKNSLYNTKG